MIAVASISLFGLSMYYLVYFFVSFFVFFLFSVVGFGRIRQIIIIHKNKSSVLFILLTLVSLAGLPPFTGFFGK